MLLHVVMGISEWNLAGLIWNSIDQVFDPSRRVRSRLARSVGITLKRLMRHLKIENELVTTGQ